MNTNKKWYKRIDTCFWFILMAFPFVFMLVILVGYSFSGNHLTSATDLTSYFENFIADLHNQYGVLMDFFKFLSMDFLTDMFSDLFNTLNVEYYTILSAIFGYMLSITFYHLLYDFLAWLPKIFGKWLNKFDD